MKVLVTGFEPYLNYPENSSWEVAKQIGNCAFDDVDVACVQLPVSFHRVAGAYHKFVDLHQPDLVVLLGQSGGSDKVKLERLAINLMDAKSADNDDYIPDEEQIDESGKSALFTSLPIKKICQVIGEQNIPVKISNSCGLYVCNRLYYEALSDSLQHPHRPVIFVHLPYYEGQPSAKPGKPCLPMTVMVDAIQLIIATIYG